MTGRGPVFNSVCLRLFWPYSGRVDLLNFVKLILSSQGNEFCLADAVKRRGGDLVLISDGGCVHQVADQFFETARTPSLQGTLIAWRMKTT